MKTNYYSLFAAAALLGLASCSSDEPNNGSNNGGLAEGENYMAFTISNVGGNSRAADTIAVENATGNEGVVTAQNVRFFFYDANGNAFNFANTSNVNGDVTLTNMVKPSEISQTENSTGAEVKTGVLVLGKAAEAGYVGAVPSQVLCVVNATDYTALQGKSLSEALNLTTTWSALTSDSSFLMTSATWVNSNNEVVTADKDIEGHIRTTPELAQQNPININIERLAAKVRAKYDDTINVQAKKTADGTDYKYIVDNKEASFTLNINGWQLHNTAVQAYTFKHLKETYNFGWNWNDATNKRSYWAETLPGTLANDSYNIADNNQFKLQSFDTNAPTSNVAYCYENTTSDSTNVFDRTDAKATAIVIKGTLNMTFDGGQTVNNVPLCKWFGSYYLESTLKGMIAQSYNTANNTSYTDANVEFVYNVADKDNSYTAVIKDGENTYDTGDNFKKILWWKNGVTSYYLNIEHQGGKLGVVRNHIYDYVFDGVIGLGFPGNDDKLPEDQETYVAAHLNILNWNLIKNSITLE